MYNRYKELKNFYKNYLVFIYKNCKYITFGDDKKIFNYLHIKKFKYLKSYGISYIVLDNLEICDNFSSLHNRYEEYYVKMKIVDALKGIRV